ncbi:MAG TPA: MarR family transcriptional regulator [Acidimicrobiales bacterium]|nr:MarR family transcriptional regulator [Acidimicrobiales bacterium]
MQRTARRADAVDAFHLASRALVGVAARSLAGEDDVTLPQWRACVVLSTRPGLTVGDLAAILDVHPSTATRLCDRLVRKRLVLRRPDRADRRTIRLELAAAGNRLVERVTERRRLALAEIVDRIPAPDLAAATEALRRFAAAAREQEGVDPFGWDPRVMS